MNKKDSYCMGCNDKRQRIEIEFKAIDVNLLKGNT